MKILTRYIAKIYIKFWFFSLLAMVLLVLVANLFGNIDRVFSNAAAFRQFLLDMLSALPSTLDVAIPLTVLLATLLTFNSLGRTSELVAMRSAGMGLLRQLRPVLAVLVLISAFDYYNQNYLYSLLGATETSRKHQNGNTQWAALGHRIYYVSAVDSKRRTLSGVQIFHWAADPFRLSEWNRVTTIAPVSDVEWRFMGITARENRGVEWPLSMMSSRLQPAGDIPDVFREDVPDAHHMPFFDLLDKIRQLESQGFSVNLFRLELYQKTAAYLAPFVLAWFGMPLAQAFFRQGQPSGNIIIGLLGGLMFLIATEIMFTLGKGGFVPPLPAAWAINLTYLGLGGVLFLRLR